MNERIKELFEQAHITTTRQVIKGGWDNDRPPYEYRTETTTEFNPEVFAQLIINKCLDVCYNTGMNSESYDGQLNVAELIKQQFGVEE